MPKEKKKQRKKAQFNYVRLAEAHPDYDHEEGIEKIITSGYVSVNDLKRDYPSKDYEVVEGRPQGDIHVDWVMYRPLTKMEKINQRLEAESEAVQAEFFMPMQAVEAALHVEKLGVARTLVSNINVDSEYLKELKQEILEII